MGTVGVVVNPLAGKDLRRLVSAATHTSDGVKIGIVRRVVAAAAETGADEILLARDRHRLAERAVEGLDAPVRLLDDELTNTRVDTAAAAERFRNEGVRAVVALGGDGTCRDIAIGWPDAPLIAISTGTNNVYPSAVDGTSAGTAAALVALGDVPLAEVAQRTKRVVVRCDDDGFGVPFDDIALVEAALIDTTFVGARAVHDPTTIRAVVAAVAHPASTGLSSIAGRLAPCAASDDHGVFVGIGAGERSVRVPLAPGSFATLGISETRPLPLCETVRLEGPGVLAYDGERDRRIGAGAVIHLHIDRNGPHLIDVASALTTAAHARRFDAVVLPTTRSTHPSQEVRHGS